MIQEPIQPLTPNLAQVRDQFENWRKTRQKRTAIPDALWEAAVSLSKDYPTLQISKALRLHYTTLKNRIQAEHRDSHPRSNCGPAFVELDFGRLPFPSECIVEMEDTTGSKMKMHLKGVAVVDLLELGKAFWSKRS
ncbi:MAG: hypothetical protein JRJ65_09810 [Deltaproteobacteria bacterium]|nr:hypothetical protein [Deltaproteobacteria bacterium]